MEHPLIGNLNELTDQQLSEAIAGLNKKLMFALRTNNANLTRLLRMAIENHTNKLQERYRANTNPDENFSNSIDIS